jgi:hypothetical protein
MAENTGSSPLSRRGFIQSLGWGAAGLGLISAGVPIARAADSAAPAADGPFALAHGPCLQVPGTNEMTVTWHTNRVGVSKVLYGKDAPDATAVASRDGLIPNDSTCHAVRLTGLEPGQTYHYRAVTREFKGYATPYQVKYGDTAESDTFTFTTLDPNKAAYSFLMWNDLHDDCRRLEAMFDDVKWDGVDFTVMNGDIISDFVTERQAFRGFYDASVSRFAKTLPMVFVRGNHETRGPMARRLSDYFPGREGKQYWSFDHGPVHYIVLDSGEDKPDDNKEYAGLVDFAPYRQEQAEWLKADLATDAAKRAKFRVVFSHQPSAYGRLDHHGVQEIRRLWDPVINAANVQLWLSGHIHDFMQRAPKEGGENVYHAVINPNDGTARVDVTPDALQVTVTRKGGEVLTTLRIPAA